MEAEDGPVTQARVLFISHCSVAARYRRRFELLAQFMPECEISLLTPRTWWEGGGFCSATEESTGNLRVLVRPAMLERSRKQHGHFYPSLHRVLREVQPDVVYLDEEPYSLVSAHTAAAVEARTRLVFCTYENLRLQDMGLSAARQAFFRLCRRIVFARADAAQAVTSGAARVLRADGFGGLVFVLPAIGYPPPDTLRPPRRAGEPLRVGYLGRLEPNKDVGTLIRAAALCAEVRLAIGGDGPERQALEQLAEAEPVRIRTVFHGRIGHDAVGEFLSGIDVLVLPSRSMPGWTEQFGRVLVEAMAHGIVPVGSASGAIPEVIGDAGWAFPERDARALAGILNELRLRTDWEMLQKRAMERAAAHFSDERIARGYAAVIQRLGRRLHSSQSGRASLAFVGQEAYTTVGSQRPRQRQAGRPALRVPR
jgi:glycosyltransferase involved in cell wall biosynthesis